MICYPKNFLVVAVHAGMPTDSGPQGLKHSEITTYLIIVS